MNFRYYWETKEEYQHNNFYLLYGFDFLLLFSQRPGASTLNILGSKIQDNFFLCQDSDRDSQDIFSCFTVNTSLLLFPDILIFLLPASTSACQLENTEAP